MISMPDWCQGRDFSREKQMLKDHGFFCHMVPEDENGMPNFHTHGMPQSLGHPDIQTVIMLPTEIYGPVIHSIYDKIKQGLDLEIGVQYDWILQEDMPVEFIWAIENDRDIMRMILPDKYGNTSKSTIGLPYGKQWVDTYELPQLGILEVEAW